MMHWSEIIARPTDRKLCEFAAAGAAVCCAVAVWQIVSGNKWQAAALLLSALAVGGVGFWKPRWLAPLFTLALIVTFPMAWATSLLVLAMIYYGLITPLGLLFRLLGRDALQRQFHAQQQSCWKRKPIPEDPRQYLRQY
jgi:hypothetical protein